MGTTERKAKEKETLKKLILSSAQKLFVEKGIEQTTIRNIAEAADYSIGTIYLHYQDKNAILHALHCQGFSEMGERFAGLHEIPDPMKRLRAMGWEYLKFALENADMYNLMLNMKAPMDFLNTINKAEWNEGTTTFDILRTTVKECMDAGHFKGHSLEPLSFMIWSVVHGMCSLKICERIGVNMEHPENIPEAPYREFLKMLDKL